MTLPVADILQPLVDVADAIIVFFHDDAAFSWGMAIIGLTFVVRLAVLPLSLRGIRSMRRMQLIAPQLQQIREKYKDDPQRFQRETMSLYREQGVNPLSSCLPFLLQIPFFIAIYNLLRGDAFREDVEASGGDEGFLFVESVIADPQGAEMVILIALFIVTTALSFLLTMATSQTASKSQRVIFMILPLAIAPFIATSPAGLAVYWIATNVFSLGQQAVVQKLMPAPKPPSPEETKAAQPPPPPPRKKKRRR